MNYHTYYVYRRYDNAIVCKILAHSYMDAVNKSEKLGYYQCLYCIELKEGNEYRR